MTPREMIENQIAQSKSVASARREEAQRIFHRAEVESSRLEGEAEGHEFVAAMLQRYLTTLDKGVTR